MRSNSQDRRWLPQAAPALLALVLGGCVGPAPIDSPTARTEYLFQGPDSDEGQRCIRGCDTSKDRCRTAADRGTEDNYRRCDEQAEGEYDACVGRTTSFSEKRQCYRKSCPASPDYAACETSYRACFEGCGGQVWSRRVCDGPC
jgi:hypothetical protein